MRLSNRIITIIKQSLNKSFGTADTYLFGSRTDDNKKGGDIDLAIDINISSDEFKKNKIKFITELMKQGYDLKIDLIQYPNAPSLLLEEINKVKIKL